MHQNTDLLAIWQPVSEDVAPPQAQAGTPWVGQGAIPRHCPPLRPQVDRTPLCHEKVGGQGDQIRKMCTRPVFFGGWRVDR